MHLFEHFHPKPAWLSSILLLRLILWRTADSILSISTAASALWLRTWWSEIKGKGSRCSPTPAGLTSHGEARSRRMCFVHHLQTGCETAGRCSSTPADTNRSNNREKLKLLVNLNPNLSQHKGNCVFSKSCARLVTSQTAVQKVSDMHRITSQTLRMYSR